MSTRTLIVGAAPALNAEAFYRALLASADDVLACDAAGEWCLSLGCRPDLVVGDFDSATPGAAARLTAAGIEVLAYPSAKDQSDLDLAVEVARKRGATQVTFTAAFSERLDHTLAAIGALVRASDLAPRIEEPSFCAAVVDETSCPAIELVVVPGSTISVLSLRAASGVTLHGLGYPLVNARLPLLSSLGLSNIATGEVVRVSVAAGTLLVIASHDETVASRD
jgi:thiamine pyrophosphokinase